MTQRSQGVALRCSEAVDRLTQSLRASGYRVDRTFDLQSARSALLAPEACPCPHHGSARCDCQYVVLLVGRSEGAPISLTAHGQERLTVFGLEEPNPFGLRLRDLVAELAETS